MAFEISECDCCKEEQISIIICPINNKCDYKLCENCVINLKEKTKTNKCPACREIIFLDDVSIDVSEEENSNIRNEENERVHTGCFKCCICIRPDYYENNIIFTLVNTYFFCLTLPCYCLYHYFFCYNECMKSIFNTYRIQSKIFRISLNFGLAILTHILFIFFCRILYLVTIDKSLNNFFCEITCFLSTSCLGFLVFILYLTLGFLLGNICCKCCCIEN